MSEVDRTDAETGLSPGELTALSERFAAVAPLLGALGGLSRPPEVSTSGGDEGAKAPSGREETVAVGGHPHGGEDHVKPGTYRGQKSSPRENLLCALRPYLSPERRETVDYLLRLCRLYEAVRCLL